MVAGDPDPGFDDAARVRHHMLLTDASLLSCFREHFPDQAGASYDEMIRLLGYVWDCAFDGTANVTGHCCAMCGRTYAAAGNEPRPGGGRDPDQGDG
jgi:hypothetical protein